MPSPKQERSRTPRKEPRRTGSLSRVLWAVLIAVVFVLLLPYLLAPLYRWLNPVSTLMVWRWIHGARVERSFVPIERMAPALPISVIAAEDGRYCRHHGVDWQELQDRLEDVDDVSEAKGVSTITQQTAKNLFLWPGRSFVRKALELPLALWMDAVLPKWRVLEIYLNIAEWGPQGQFGAEAASRYAFNKPARLLTPHEAALLAAVLPNPRRRSAKQPGPVVRRLANTYEARANTQAALAACAWRARAVAHMSQRLGAKRRPVGSFHPLPPADGFLYKRAFRTDPRATVSGELSHGCSQAKNLAVKARDAPLG